MENSLVEHVLMPVANEDDARTTAEALEPYSPERVTAVHVVEKAGGAPDKTSPEYSKQVAENSYAAVREVFPDAEGHTSYGRDVVQTVFEAADEVDATAIAYRSRGGGRLMHFLSGDLSLKLVTKATLPVIALPREG